MPKRPASFKSVYFRLSISYFRLFAKRIILLKEILNNPLTFAALCCNLSILQYNK